MPSTLFNIDIQQNQWIDLYAVSGLPVGTQISIENVGSADVYLTVKETQPDADYDAYNVVVRGGLPKKNTVGDVGAWAYCPSQAGKLSLRAM